jgi:hypothetical protein
MLRFTFTEYEQARTNMFTYVERNIHMDQNQRCISNPRAGLSNQEICHILQWRLASIPSYGIYAFNSLTSTIDTESKKLTSTNSEVQKMIIKMIECSMLINNEEQYNNITSASSYNSAAEYCDTLFNEYCDTKGNEDPKLLVGHCDNTAVSENSVN